MKRILLLVLLLVFIAGGWYVYREYNRGKPGLAETEAAHETDAATLIGAFEKDSAAASKQFIDAVIIVTGTLQKIDSAERPFVALLSMPNSYSSVKCSIDPAQHAGLQLWGHGETVRIKGKVTGFQHDELLGTDVELVQCVPQPYKK